MPRRQTQTAELSIGHADLTAAATSQAFDFAAALPADAVVIGATIAVDTGFTDGGSGVFTVDVGTVSGTADSILDGADIASTAVVGTPAGSQPTGFYGGATLRATVRAGVNVDTATAGELVVEVYYLTAETVPVPPPTSSNTRNIATLLTDGTLARDSGGLRRSAITGDVNIPAASNTATIPNGAVTNAKLASMAANTVKGTLVGGTPVDVPIGDIAGGADNFSYIHIEADETITVPSGQQMLYSGEIVIESGGQLVTPAGAQVVCVDPPPAVQTIVLPVDYQAIGYSTYELGAWADYTAATVRVIAPAEHPTVVVPGDGTMTNLSAAMVAPGSAATLTRGDTVDTWIVDVSSPFETFDVALNAIDDGLTTGDAKNYLTVLTPFWVVGFSVTCIPGGEATGDTEINIRRNGTDIFSSPLTLPSTENVSSAYTLVNNTARRLDLDDVLLFDVDAVGTGAEGVRVQIYGFYLQG